MAAFDVLKSEQLRQYVLGLMNAAVTASQQQGAPAWLAPFATLYVPKHRFEKLDPAKAPFLHVVAPSDGGAGKSLELPHIDSVAVLHVNVLHACGRDDAADLDSQAGLLAEAVCLQILEDQGFLRQIRKVEALRITHEDGVAGGDGSGEYDVVVTQIEIECSVGPIRFEPRVPADQTNLAAVQVTTPVGGAQTAPNSVVERVTVPQ